MSQPFAGFIGPSYQLSNRWAAIERCANWFLVPVESSDETKSRVVFDPFPGNRQFSALPLAPPFNQPCRGLLENRGAVYGVNGTCVYILLPSGAMQQLGNIVSDGKPVSMTANGNGQIGISSAGRFWVFEPAGWAAEVPVGDKFLGSGVITFQDGYVIAVTPNSNQFQISGTDDIPIGDMRVWDAANVSIQAGQADNLRAVHSSRNTSVCLAIGARRSTRTWAAPESAVSPSSRTTRPSSRLAWPLPSVFATWASPSCGSVKTRGASARRGGTSLSNPSGFRHSR